MKLTLLFTSLLAGVSTVVATPSSGPDPVKDLIIVSSSDNATISGRDLAGRAPLPGETVTCYNVGSKIDRSFAVAAIDSWCASIIGQFWPSGTAKSMMFTWLGSPMTMYVAGSTINGCSFTVDDNCNRLLRLPIDGCNTGGVNGKQGGFETDQCGLWTADPGSNGGRF
ncbi:hypothetical protein BD410DRAFT_845757 [Rickenella mellea]|uniref:Ecp2 effector protein domain-containing protein n=1 Tax=Rickenella mellea TaxID=50990 RepID=A0A4Y7PJZ4_9AGAM|nr:hypothetical protein BD410DRAFT_845757 [Rickenella mellea]